MTTVLDPTPTTPTQPVSPDEPLASWSRRAAAFAVDTLPGLGVTVTMALLALGAPADGWVRWVYTGLAAATLFLVAFNRLVLPHAVGFTLGRALLGLTVCDRAGGQIGVARLTGRELAHLLDTLSMFVGWLWPLWDRRRRTFADLLMRTEVRRRGQPSWPVRRIVAGVLIAAVAICGAGVGVGYAVVYRHERAVDEARTQIAEQGPRIIEQMLSYGVDSMSDDFAHAQTLATDSYRPQLIAQQQAAQGAGATSNEYWAVSSAVLTNPPVTPGHAAMLLAMQGQRGTNPEDLRFITATVRAEFDKSPQGQWQVANLTVLKKPQMGQAGQ